MGATQKPLESVQDEENSLQFEKVYMERRLITRLHTLGQQMTADLPPSVIKWM